MRDQPPAAVQPRSRRQPRAFGGKLGRDVAAAVALDRDQAGHDRQHEAGQLRRAGEAAAVEPGREDRHRQRADAEIFAGADIVQRFQRHQRDADRQRRPRHRQRDAPEDRSSGWRRAFARPRRIPRSGTGTSRAPRDRRKGRARAPMTKIAPGSERRLGSSAHRVAAAEARSRACDGQGRAARTGRHRHRRRDRSGSPAAAASATAAARGRGKSCSEISHAVPAPIASASAPTPTSSSAVSSSARGST